MNLKLVGSALNAKIDAVVEYVRKTD